MVRKWVMAVNTERKNNMHKSGICFPTVDARTRSQTKKMQAGTPAWQRKEGKNPKGGLNEKGRKSYEAQNPGSDLKPPQPKGGPRKKSFCARMCGMKKKRTSKKTASNRDSRINKSLRAWNCSC